MTPIDIPSVIADALGAGATLAISVSGGKDSTALTIALAQLRQQHGWTGPVYAVHADLGRAEWVQSLPFARKVATEHGIDFVDVRRPQGDLVQEIEDRVEKLAGTAPAWPSSAARYCTSDQKRAQIDKVVTRAAPFPDAANRYCTSHQKSHQIDKVVRNPWPTASMRYCTSDQKRSQLDKVHRHGRTVVAAMGLRAQESTARAKKEGHGLCGRTTSTAVRDLSPAEALAQRLPGQHVTLDWLPILGWSEDDVWATCGTSRVDLERRRELYLSGRAGEALDGWPCHPAYVFGNQRVSCGLCVLAGKNDLIVGAAHNPELYRTYVAIERRTGFAFKRGLSLESLAPQIAAYAAKAGLAWEVA